jgi:hypothetical protein
LRSGFVVVGILTMAVASCATIPTPSDANDAILMLRKYDASAWAIGIALIWGDLVLPVPQTVVIAALGIIYGTVLGGLLGSVGLITGGLLGYVLMLTSARRIVKRGTGCRQRPHRVHVCGHRCRLGRPADPGTPRELCAPNPGAARCALSHALPSDVRSVRAASLDAMPVAPLFASPQTPTGQKEVL